MKSTELYKIRQSVRRYTDAKVSREILSYCIDAARLAPSASNSQPWKFVVADQEPIRTRLAEATFSELVPFNRFTLQAPVIVVLIIDKAKLITRLAMKVKSVTGS